MYLFSVLKNSKNKISIDGKISYSGPELDILSSNYLKSPRRLLDSLLWAAWWTIYSYIMRLAIWIRINSIWNGNNMKNLVNDDLESLVSLIWWRYLRVYSDNKLLMMITPSCSNQICIDILIVNIGVDDMKRVTLFCSIFSYFLGLS